MARIDPVVPVVPPRESSPSASPAEVSAVGERAIVPAVSPVRPHGHGPPTSNLSHLPQLSHPSHTSILPSTTTPSTTTTTTTTTRRADMRDEDNTTSDHVHDVVDDKAVTGWTALAEASCERCRMSLLRDTHGRILCMTCRADEARGHGNGNDENHHDENAPSAVIGTDAIVAHGRQDMDLSNSNRMAVATTTTATTRPSSRSDDGTTHVQQMTVIGRNVSMTRHGREDLTTRRTNGRTRTTTPVTTSTSGHGNITENVPTRLIQNEDGGEVDVELRAVRDAAVETLRQARCALLRARGAEGRRVWCATMSEACRTIAEAQRALGWRD